LVSEASGNIFTTFVRGVAEQDNVGCVVVIVNFYSPYSGTAVETTADDTREGHITSET